MSIARPLIACVLAFLVSLAPAQIAAAPADFLPDGRALFAGCTPSAEGSNGRFYACTGHSAGIVHMFAGKEMDLQKAEAIMAAAVRTMMPKEVREERLTIELDGKTCSGIRVLPASREAAAMFGVAEVVVVPVRGGDFRGLWVVCQRRSDRCDQQRREIFQYLAAKGPPERVTIDKRPEVGPPKLLGRTLEVPDGCQLAAANSVTGRIQCNGSVMSWNVVSVVPKLEKWLDEVAAQMEPALGGGILQRANALQGRGKGRQVRASVKAASRGSLALLPGRDGHREEGRHGRVYLRRVKRGLPCRLQPHHHPRVSGHKVKYRTHPARWSESGDLRPSSTMGSASTSSPVTGRRWPRARITRVAAIGVNTIAVTTQPTR